MTKISIIIPTYNHCSDLLKPCLESIIEYTDPSIEVIVVANGCTDETRQYVESLGSQFKLLWYEEGLGYTKATNAGIRAATGDYIVLLNNDIILLGQEKNAWINILQRPFVDEKVGLTGVHQQFSQETNSHFFCFYCVMIRKNIIDQLGLLDESFSPGFGEDIDYCKKIELAGYKLIDCESNKTYSGSLLVGDFPIYHPGSSTFHDAEHGHKYEKIVQRNIHMLRNRYSGERLKHSIVIPTYNHCNDFLKPCLESIKTYTNLDDTEVIVVANGCNDETEEYVKSLGDKFVLLFYEEKLGYTKATNIGIKASRGEYVVLLNNDVVLLPQDKSAWLERLRQPFVDEKVGIVGLDPLVDDRTQSRFFGFFCVMIKRDVFKTVGLLDEIFSPGLGEDIDYCKRAELAGYKLEACVNNVWNGRFNHSDFPIYHPGSSTFRDVEHDEQYWHILHRNIQVIKNRYELKYSIIIPTYNHCDDLLKPCLESIKKYTILGNVEVLVVANGCTDGTKQYVESLGAPFKLLWIDKQVGFIKAVNRGMVEAKGQYIILLNNDTYLLPQEPNYWVKMLEKPFLTNEKMGLTGPKILHCPFSEIDYLMFFCVMIKKQAIEAIGLLDERYGMGLMDDQDYCFRAMKAGFNIEQVPEQYGDAPIMHTSNVSFGCLDRDSMTKKNMYLMMDKYFPDDIVYIIVSTYKRYDLLKEALNSVLKQTYKKIKVFVVSDGPDEKVRDIVNEFNFFEIDRHKDQFNYISFEYMHLDEHEGAVGGGPKRRGIDALPERGYVCFLDDDNILYPDYVARLRSAISLDANISYCQIINFINVNGEILFAVMPETEQIVFGRIDSLSVMVNNSIAKQCKDKWAQGQGTDPNNRRISHDFDFIEACLQHSKGNFVKEVLGEHRAPKTAPPATQWIQEPVTPVQQSIEALFQSLEQQDVLHFKGIFHWNCYDAHPEEIKDKIVLDIGANKGIFSIWSVLNGAKKCYSFEPNKKSHQTLLENIQMFPNIIPSKLAMSKPGLQQAHISLEDWWCQVHEEGEGEIVDCISLDEFLQQLPADEDLIMKIDCEGSEYDILFNCRKESLRRFKYIYSEIHDDMHSNKNYNYDMFEKFMNEMGYHSEETEAYHPGIAIGMWYPQPDGSLDFATFPPSEHPQNKQFKFTRIEEVPKICEFFDDLKITKKKTYDCFTFFNELDMLELRLNELDEVVDYFVLSEATKTHSGKDKPLYFAENKERFAKFLPKIKHIVVDFPETDDPWVRERYQRECLAKGLVDCQDNDIIIAGDIDEIPRKERVLEYKIEQGLVGFDMDYSFYYMNCVRQDKGTTHFRIMPYHVIKAMESGGQPLCQARYTPCPLIPNGGWHFSFMGGKEGIITKFQSYAHQEYNNSIYTDPARIEHFLENGGDILDKNMDFQFVSVDESFPAYVLQNLNWFVEKGYIKSSAKGKSLLPTQRPSVSIVIPTYNHFADHLKPCLDSIVQNTDLNDVEVIVVANGCTDETEEYVKGLGSPFKLIVEKERLGFVKPTNIGIKASQGDYVILLNNDTMLYPHDKHGWINMLKAPFNDSSVAITGVLELYDYYAGDTNLVFCCVMIKREIFEKLGCLDEAFHPGGGDDVDFTLRCRENGYKTILLDNSKDFPIYHQSSQAPGGGTFSEFITPQFVLDAKKRGLLNTKRHNKHIRLNLGSGDIEIPSYLSVDNYNEKAWIMMDIANLDFEENTVEEIIAIHSFEHLNPYHAETILRNWLKVLKPGGCLIMEMPDVAALCERFVVADKGERYGILSAIYGVANTKEGTQEIFSPHLFGWYSDILYEHLVAAGFTNIVFGPPEFSRPGISFRVTCQKPN